MPLDAHGSFPPISAAPSGPSGAAATPAPGVHPGVERWPVKTGTDKDVSAVAVAAASAASFGKDVSNTTIAKLIALPRAANMPALKDSFPPNSFYQDQRFAPTETTIWRVQAQVTFIRLEQDGDYHMVLKDAAGNTMIAEVPNPTAAFVKNAEWLSMIAGPRKAVDAKLKALGKTPTGFKPAEISPPDTGRPRKAEPATTEEVPLGNATVIGVGFFDSDHGQDGVAPNAIELHPVLDIVFS